ncbi:MAG TPA: GreA/GreB family elongation factor [Steroidobacteraceae bacterium]|nr:GreA/GreB family elongation factor [Steroidobacteraceae bacterium]
MSRAFVRESDQDAAADNVPERIVSPHPNLVTPQGLKQIDEQIRALEAERQAARSESDPSATARVARELRYWSQRRATARLVEPLPQPDAVRFGVEVKLGFEDGTERTFRLVGEDEADPGRGLISWVSPIGAALMGHEPGDTVNVLDKPAEIVELRS